MPACLKGCCAWGRKAGVAMSGLVDVVDVVAGGDVEADAVAVAVAVREGGNGLSRLDVNAVAANEDGAGRR